MLAKYAAPGHWNDPDMLLIGNDCITDAEAQTQMAIWSISAAPLIMGNDLRNMSDSQRAILLNQDAIAVDQDPLGKMGTRVSPSGPTEVWARQLQDGSVAVGLYNKEANTSCGTYNKTDNGYPQACGGPSGDIGCFTDLTVAEAESACCSNTNCVAFSFKAADGSGCWKVSKQWGGGGCLFVFWFWFWLAWLPPLTLRPSEQSNIDCGMVNDTTYAGYIKPAHAPPPAGTSITVQFADVGLKGKVAVRDIWAQKDVGVFETSYTATNVAVHGTAFLKLTPSSA